MTPTTVAALAAGDLVFNEGPRQTVTMSCWRQERDGEVYVGPFQVDYHEAVKRDGKTFGLYRWAAAYHDRFGRPV